jgi:hypothetical protein
MSIPKTKTVQFNVHYAEYNGPCVKAEVSQQWEDRANLLSGLLKGWLERSPYCPDFVRHETEQALETQE